MASPRDYRQTVLDRAQREPEFAALLKDEAVALSLAGEPDTARVLAQLRAITPGTRKGEADSRV